MRAAVLILLAACSRTPAPKAPTSATGYQDTLYCFGAQTVGGNGMVCTDRLATCKTIRGITAVTDGVTQTSDCILSAVTVTKE